MPLLQITNPQAPVYKDSRAGTLLGSGNTNFTKQQIQNYINQPGRTADQTLQAALAYGVSAKQLSDATDGKYSVGDITNFASNRGISFDQRPQEQIQYKIPEATASRARFTPAKQDPVKGTVAGQLDSFLKDPNHPLLKRAETFANQQTNRRGLLNSSMNTGAAQAAMTDAALQVATPDAQSNNQFSLFNADTENKVDQFNADQANRVGMFNAGNATDIIKNRESLENSLNIALLDTNTKTAIADLQARSEDSKYAASLYDTLLKIQQELNANPDIKPDDKNRYISDAVRFLTSGINLLDTFEGVDLGDLVFPVSGNS